MFPERNVCFQTPRRSVDGKLLMVFRRETFVFKFLQCNVDVPYAIPKTQTKALISIKCYPTSTSLSMCSDQHSHKLSLHRSQWASPFSVRTGQRTLLPVGQQRQNCQVVVTKQPWWWHRAVGKLVDILPTHAIRVPRGHGGVRAANRLMRRQPSCKS